MKIKELEAKVNRTINDYNLISHGDKVLIAYSGGKDSTSVLYLLKKLGYNVEALMIDLLLGDYSKKHLDNAESFCKELGVKLHVINIREAIGNSICYIRSGVQAKHCLSNCHICGVIKRWLLNKEARSLGANKLATGHNLDDESETLLMNLFSGNPKLLLNSGPKNGLIINDNFIQRIKPLYFCTNDEVKAYSKIKHFPVLYDKCPCSSKAFRNEIRKHLNEIATPKIKAGLMKNFLKMLPGFKSNYQPLGELKYCNNCGEPSRGGVCRTCSLINNLRT